MTVSPVCVELHDDLAWVTIDNPPVNATSAAVRQGLAAAVAEVAGRDLRAAVLRCAGRTFVAGGDITEFDAAPVKPDLPDVIRAIEDCPVPWIAAMHGSVFGGGLEIALGCAWRVAAPGTRFALPEVTLGIVPGAGGTQRLPRLVGVAMALEMATTGAPVPTESFEAAGGLDAVLPDLSEDRLIAFARSCGPRPETTRTRPVDAPGASWWTERERDVRRRAAGAAAPVENLRLVRRATSVPFDEGQPDERARHLALRVSEQSRALRHVFFAERQAARLPALSGLKPPRLQSVALLGEGDLADRLAAETQAAGLALARWRRAGDARNPGAPPDLCLLAGIQDAPACARAVADLADHLGPEISVAIAQDVEVDEAPLRPIAGTVPTVSIGFAGQGAGALVEIVTYSATPPQQAARALDFARRLALVPVVTNDAERFVSARLWSAVRRHACDLASGGVAPDRIEAAWADFGARLGLFPDGTGAPEPCGDETATDALCEGLLAVLINEGARAVEEKRVGGPAVIDVIAIAGCGFPRWRGGPMHHADAVGIDRVAGWMQAVMTARPGRWRLSDLLSRGAA